MFTDLKRPKFNTPVPRNWCPHSPCATRQAHDELLDNLVGIVEVIPELADKPMEAALLLPFAIIPIGLIRFGVIPLGYWLHSFLSFFMTQLLVDVAIGVIVFMTFATWMFLNSKLRDRLMSYEVRFVGGLHDGQTTLVINGRVACDHGHQMSSVCRKCRRSCGMQHGLDWYHVSDDMALFVPHVGVVHPEMNGRPIDPRLTATFHILATVANDIAVKDLVSDLIKLATKLLNQKEPDAKFDAAVVMLGQEAIATVTTSSIVTLGLSIANDAMSANIALEESEHEQVVAADELLGKVYKSCCLDLRTFDGEAKIISDIRQKLRAALDAKPAPLVLQEDNSLASEYVLYELEIIKGGIDSIVEDGEDMETVTRLSQVACDTEANKRMCRSTLEDDEWPSELR